MTIEISTPSDVMETLEELNPSAIMYEGFDSALVGIIARCGTEPLALYDREKCIQVLVDKGLEYSKAVEYFCFHIEGCWAGPHTPFIASFNLDPVGIRYPVEDLQVVTSDCTETEILLGLDSEGNSRIDFANVGSGIVDGAPESGGPVGSVDGDEVSAGSVLVDGDVKS